MFGRKRKVQDLADEATVSEWLGTVGQVIETRERELTRRAAGHLDGSGSRTQVP
jgi:hypothetical protein